MTAFSTTTQRRLKKLPQIPSVWEGDRRPLSGIAENLDPDSEDKGECIVWLDGSEGVVRGMEVVSPEMGPEAIVRTLLRAMENPQTPAIPARPRKIVVRDREIQFFLRGALQNLDISIDYVPELPVIDEFFRGFSEITSHRPPALPPKYAEIMFQVAEGIWFAAPWELLADYHILSIEIQPSDRDSRQWDIKKLYACVMGMLGKEYGVLLYRSEESLKQFRAAAATEESIERLEKAFLAQDCWFLNFESVDNDFDPEDEDFDLAELEESEIHPFFGSVHPYEGMRPFLDEEEAIAVYVALKALLNFIEKFRRQLAKNTEAAIAKSFSISLPGKTTVTVEVSTLPELADELLAIGQAEAQDSEMTTSVTVPLQDDLIPEDSFRSLGVMPWDAIESVRNSNKKYYQSLGASRQGEGMPIVLIQTSRPKAKLLSEKIQADGGLKAICFNPGEDPFTDMNYDLGILQTGKGNLFLFGEFIGDDPTHLEARKQWDRRCLQTQGYCGLVIASGLTGAARGNPQLRDTIALFEAKAISAEELGMGVLQLMPMLDFELD
ncbi:MAG: hypothetical protein SAL07_00535 [Oscillatoria sp. PMC 1051.18]|nr:hypothetical protein [Oscillatoria sp. PMC 1050.18]MEC5028373.1 hypothetical protein [Oscillatoria sp. PMC 1051.18]